MSPSQHKHPPLSFRPQKDSDRVWLHEYARRKGLPVSRVLADALAAYRSAKESSQQEMS